MVLESCLPILVWVSHDWCFQGLTTLRILLGENENTYLPIQNSKQSGPWSCFSNLIFFPCSIHIFYYWHTHLQNISCTSHGLYLLTISLSWRLFLSVFFSLHLLFFLYSPVQSKLALPSFCWQLACMVNSNLSEILISDFLNHLFDTYIVPFGISHFVVCTHI